MPPARQWLMHAASVQMAENRLTETFATVLSRSSELADGLFTVAGLEPGSGYEVVTQPLLGSRRPDMRITAFGSSGAPQTTAWFEHKVGAPFSAEQREDYALEAASLPGAHRLVVIVDDASLLNGADGGRWSELTWQQVAELAADVCRAALGEQWRTVALGPDVAAKWRLVAELLWVLQEERAVAMTDPLTDEHLAALPVAVRAEDVLDTLLERALDTVAARGVTTTEKPYQGWGISWHHLQLPQPSWLARFGADANPELAFGEASEWTTRYTGLAYGAGFAFPERFAGALGADSDWAARVEAAGFTAGVWEDFFVVYRTLLASELTAEPGRPLQDQAARLGSFAADAVLALADIPSAVDPAVVPERTRRRRRPPPV